MLKYDEDDMKEWRQAVAHAEQERNDLRRELNVAYRMIDRLNEEAWSNIETIERLEEEIRSMDPEPRGPASWR